MKRIKKKIIFLFLILLLFSTQQINAEEELDSCYEDSDLCYEEIPDLCYEEPIYEGSSCVDMGDGFNGGRIEPNLASNLFNVKSNKFMKLEDRFYA